MSTKVPLPDGDEIEDTVIFDHAAREYGETAQLLQAMEEVIELQAAILDYLRGEVTYDDVLEEAADIHIMAGALPYALADDYGPNPSDQELDALFETIRCEKLERQARRLGLT